MRAKHFAAILLILSPLNNPSHAQGSVQADGPRRLTFQTLRDSQWVRLVSPEVGRREGRVLERSSTELVLSSDAQPVRVSAATVDTLWTRGNHAFVGGLVGAIALGGLGLAAGFSSGFEENAGSAGTVLATTGIGAAAGFFLGAVLGAAAPRWHRRYP
jgi:hypothetical protein